MKTKIKIGNKVKLLRDVVQKTAKGEDKYLKGTIGIICDTDNELFPFVELKDANGLDSCNCFSVEDLEIIE